MLYILVDRKLAIKVKMILLRKSGRPILANTIAQPLLESLTNQISSTIPWKHLSFWQQFQKQITAYCDLLYK